MRGTVVVAIAIVGLGVAGCGSTAQVVVKPPSGLTAIAAPVPSGFGSRFSEELRALSCPAAGSCVVAGDGYVSGRPPSAPEGLLLSETSGKWSAFTVPLPSTLPAGAKSAVDITALSCPAVGHCVAIGSAHAGANFEVLVIDQQGKRWPVTALKPPRAATYGGLVSLSCAAVGECSAIGWFQKGRGRQHLGFLDEKHGRWADAWREDPLPAAADPSAGVEVGPIACTAAGDCAAIGSYTTRNHVTKGLIVSERKGVWGRIVEPRLPQNAGNRGLINLAALSCPSLGNCTVIGGYFDKRQSQQGFTLTARHGKWARAVELPVPADAVANIQHGDTPEPPLTAISCPSVGNCSADGWYRYTQDNQHMLLLSEKAGKWTPNKVALPSNAVGGGPDPGGLGEIACVSAGNCVAVGGYVTGRRSDGNDVAVELLLMERHGVWVRGVPGVTSVDIRGGFSAGLDLVACPPKHGDCLAVGSYTDARNVDHSDLLTVARP